MKRRRRSPGGSSGRPDSIRRPGARRRATGCCSTPACSLTKNGFPYTREEITDLFGFEVAPTDISILEPSTGLRYNAKDRYYYKNQQDRYAGGSPRPTSPARMRFKAGLQTQRLVYNQDYVVNERCNTRSCAACRRQITQWAQPLLYQVRTRADLGLYAQDKWTIRRLTLNYGLRFEYYNGYVPETSLPAGRFVGVRELPAVNGLPEWTDLNPRVGGSYDLFGNGRTALKASIGRYVGKMATTIGVLGNPLSTSVNSVNRTWTDSERRLRPRLRPEQLRRQRRMRGDQQQQLRAEQSERPAVRRRSAARLRQSATISGTCRRRCSTS